MFANVTVNNSGEVEDFECSDINDLLIRALDCKVKIKLETGEIFQFNPYYTVSGSGDNSKLECKVEWLHSIEYTRKTLYVYEIVELVSLGVETDNIEDLCKCNYDTSKLKLNMNL